MNRRRRLLTACKWTCTVLAILIATVTLASRWWELERTWTYPVTGVMSIQVGGGIIQVTDSTSQDEPVVPWRLTRINHWDWTWGNGDKPARWHWHYGFMHIDAKQWQVYGMTLLYPTFLTALAASLLWWPDLRALRRKRAGHCPTCNYDRRGLAPDAVCPECGKSQGIRIPVS